jgi:uncharacterized protein (TIGR00661 family)|tara:strand:- start:322 stop:1341 length:1020 start_codon:yes stop_codon:yes gene_type:complete
LKILYYVTDHGLGHASRTVAIIRELKKKNIQIIVRNNDPFEFFKKSLPGIQIISGDTDFQPVMSKKNDMLFNESKTKANLSNWIHQMPMLIKKESTIIKKIKPNVIISDISFMPILAASKNKIKSILVSSFIWNESLKIPNNMKQYIKNSYKNADIILRLSLGTPVNLQNVHKMGVVARHSTLSRKQIRKNLKIKPNEKLILFSLSRKEKIQLKHSKNIKILDVSDYSIIKKSGITNLVEGQNLITAADLVICKCGYGFISECLTSKTKFLYVVESKHIESNSIHKELEKLGLKNRISVKRLVNTIFDDQFIESAMVTNVPFDNQNVAKKIIEIADRVI